MMAVASHPEYLLQRRGDELAHLAGVGRHDHERDHDGHDDDAIHHGAPDQRLDRVERREIDAGTGHDRHDDGRIEALGLVGADARARSAICALRRSRRPSIPRAPVPPAGPCRRCRARTAEPPTRRRWASARRPPARWTGWSVWPLALSVTAVVRMMKKATMFDAAMPIHVSQPMRCSCCGACCGSSISGPASGIGLLVLDLLRTLPEEEIGADGGAEDRDDQRDRGTRKVEARTNAPAATASSRCAR